MSQIELEQALRKLSETGTLIKGRSYREVWRFESGGKGYYLKFYPRQGKRLKRVVRGDPAMREFLRLQWLQKAGIPAPRAVAVLKGFKVGEKTGDAVISEAIEPGTPVDQVFNEAELRGEDVPNHYEIAQQIIGIVSGLAQAKLGHSDLHLGNFLLSNRKVYLLDAYAVRRGGLQLRDVLLLGHSAARYATRQDIVRGWREVGPAETAIPQKNRLSPRLWRKQAKRATAKNRYFSRLHVGEWEGLGFRLSKFPYPWSDASRLQVEGEEWERVWGELVARIEAGKIDYLKQSASGDVMAASVEVGGRLLDVVIKQPKRKQWHRYFTDVLRGDRAMRAWTRAWELIARQIPTAWPLMILRRRVAGYPLESYIVYERVRGVPLAHVKLEEMAAEERALLFRRVGRLLRRIDDTGYYHRDAKSDNIMVEAGNRPVLVDLDGVRSMTFGRWSLPRLLTSMKDHKQYTPADSLALCRGYAPFARVQREAEAPEQSAEKRPGAEERPGPGVQP